MLHSGTNVHQRLLEAALQARIARDRALARLDYAPERERLGALHDSLFR
jgi:hypothetical protein